MLVRSSVNEGNVRILIKRLAVADTPFVYGMPVMAPVMAPTRRKSKTRFRNLSSFSGSLDFRE